MTCRRRMLAAAVLLACAGCGPASPHRSQPSGISAPQAIAPADAGTIPCRPSARSAARGRPRFAPPTRREGNATVMPVTFPDGTTAELRYPPELDLARLGVWARTSGVLGSDSGTGRGLEIVHGDAAGLTAGRAPVACYQGTDGGQVELWRTPDPDLPYWLLFRFGADHDGDVQLQLGDLSPRAVLLWPIRCTSRARPVPSRLGRDWFASWCLPKAPVEVHVYDSDGSFGGALIKGLQVRDVRHAHPPDRYHVVP